MTKEEKIKKCFNCCPVCDATDPDLNWGDKEWFDDAVCQDAICNKCGCEFQEVYEYNRTEYSK